MSLVFDLESNGLLHQLDTIHCIAIYDTKCADRRVNALKIYHGPDGIKEALDLIAEADEIIGHNVIGFDIPAIQKVSPGWHPKGKVTDTLVISRLVAADLRNDDATSLGLPEGFQRSEFLLEKGAIDLIVDRRNMRETLARMLAKFTGQDSPVKPVS